jgi:hypothetical protein
MDAADVETRISQKLEAGELPCDEEDRTWAGPGLDLLCSACGRPITVGETEVELDFTRMDGIETFRFHRQCYTLWELRKEVDC